MCEPSAERHVQSKWSGIVAGSTVKDACAMLCDIMAPSSPFAKRHTPDLTSEVFSKITECPCVSGLTSQCLNQSVT